MVALDANAARPASAAALAAYEDASLVAAHPTAPHARGRAAKRLLDEARARIAHSINAQEHEIIFTSGGTEAAALAVAGCLHGACGGHLVTTCLEHPAVTRTAAMVASHAAFRWTQVPCPRSGRMESADLYAACGDDTRLISMIAASNETGVIQPITEVAAWCRDRGIIMHTDAVQAMGRMPLDVQVSPVALASWAGHKVGAVGAIGCLYAREGTVLQPPWRPIVAVGAPLQALEDPEISVAAAASLAAALAQDTTTTRRQVQRRRDAFEQALREKLADVEILGADVPRLGHTSCVRFGGCAADGLMMALDLQGFYCSTGSACSSGSIEPSPVLLGMGLTPQQAGEALRFSLDDSVTDDDLARLLEALVALVGRARPGHGK